MDQEKLRKRQSIRIIVSEAIMVIAVIAIVSVLALIVSGYWLNSDFTVERQGLLQISSMPTGADVSIDGESFWLQRTNTSKVLSSGEHEVVLSKDGYDTWSKRINIKEGLLYKIHYPRLFLQDRTPEKVFDVTDANYATISPNKNILLLLNDTTNWQVFNLGNESLKPNTINIAPFFSSVSLADGASKGLLNSKVTSINWDQDNTHVLIKVEDEELFEWALIDINNPEKSINLTKEFGASFDSIKIIDRAANNLLAISNQNLHKINIPSKTISSIIVKNIVSFDHFDNELIYVSKNEILDSQDDGVVEEPKYDIRTIDISGSNSKLLETINAPAQVAITKFYDDYYYVIMQDNQLFVHQKQNYDQVTDYQLSFTPESIKVGHFGEFIVSWQGQQVATLDMELAQIREWQVEGKSFDWLDNDMIYTIYEGDLIVYDYDGFNRRYLAKNVSSHFPVGITDDKWLYYFSDDELIREWIIEH